MKIKPYFAGALFAVLFIGLVYAGQSLGFRSSEERGKGHGRPPIPAGSSEQFEKHGDDEDFEFDRETPVIEENENENKDNSNGNGQNQEKIKENVVKKPNNSQKNNDR